MGPIVNAVCAINYIEIYCLHINEYNVDIITVLENSLELVFYRLCFKIQC